MTSSCFRARNKMRKYCPFHVVDERARGFITKTRINSSIITSTFVRYEKGSTVFNMIVYFTCK